MEKQKGAAKNRDEKLGTEMVPRTEGALALTDDFEQYAGRGFEEASSKADFAIPFLTILQSLSPGVQEGLDGYKPGRILNTVTKEVSDELIVVPVHYSRSFVEWVPRNRGGGFRGEFTPAEREQEFNEKLDRKTGKAHLDNGNELTDTRNFYVLIGSPDGTVSPALISMTSTQIAKAKELNSLLNKKRRGKSGKLYTPAMAVNVVKLSTEKKSNAKGTWFRWKFELLGDNDQRAQIEEGLALQEQVKRGEVVVDRTQDQQDIIDGDAPPSDFGPEDL